MPTILVVVPDMLRKIGLDPPTPQICKRHPSSLFLLIALGELVVSVCLGLIT